MNAFGYLRFRVRYCRVWPGWFWRERLSMRLAWWLPRQVAMWAFLRVYAAAWPDPGPDFSERMKAWEQGAGK